MAEKKTFRGQIGLKEDGQEGTFRAEFATLGVIDHQDDVTEAGAFEDGQETLIEAWNHNYGVLPVGKGVIHEVDGKAVIEGGFFLESESGLEHYRVVKALGPLQEWSYTFEIVDCGFGKFEDQNVRFLRKLDVWGVAPVTRGAGIDTRTVAIKDREETAAWVADFEAAIKELSEVLAPVMEKIDLVLAKVGDGGGEGAGQGKGGSSGEGADTLRSSGPSTLAARVAVELLEAGVEEAD